MEKRFLMKLLSTLLLTSALILTGCATTSSVDPMYPNGPLKPLGQGKVGSSEVAELEATGDLWVRIRKGFAMPNLEQDLVQNQEQWYATRPDYIQRMTERSSKYLFHIVEELERRNMPTELALLPFIESAFNPQAVSSAKAAGMWQFMPATGRDFDLKQNAFRDDRRDVLGSTRAALDYLQKLYNMFGDWHLALAAYNWGEGSVSRAISRNQASGLGTGYLDLKMPNETRYYVPKLQAVKNIVARPESFGTVLPLIENNPFFDTIDITKDIDVAVAAQLAEVRLEDFKALNPSQRKPVIFAAGTPQVLLPWDNAATFKRNMAKYDPAKLASWTAWVAPANISAREAANRVGMDESEFRSINSIPPRMLVKAGSTLLVPRADDAPQAAPRQVVNNASVAYAPEVVLKRFVVRARKGDSISRLAGRYDLPPATVAGWNRSHATATLKPGQAVVVYLPVRAGASAAAAALSRNNSGARSSKAVHQAPHKAGRSAPKAAAKQRAPAKRAAAAPKAKAKGKR